MTCETSLAPRESLFLSPTKRGLFLAHQNMLFPTRGVT